MKLYYRNGGFWITTFPPFESGMERGSLACLARCLIPRTPEHLVSLQCPRELFHTIIFRHVLLLFLTELSLGELNLSSFTTVLGQFHLWSFIRLSSNVSLTFSLKTRTRTLAHMGAVVFHLAVELNIVQHCCRADYPASFCLSFLFSARR